MPSFSRRIALLSLISMIVTTPAFCRTRVAVIDLKAKVGVNKDMASLLSDVVRTELYQTGVFDVMNREDMVSILGELKFQESGACDSTECAVSMGSALGVERMVTGSVGKMGKTFVINLKLINIQLMKNEMLLSKYHKGSEDNLPDSIKKVIERMAKEHLVKEKARKKSAKKQPAVKKKPTKKSRTSTKKKRVVRKKEEPTFRGGHSLGTAIALGFLPGAGQVYNGQGTKGCLLAAAGSAAIVGSLLYNQAGSDADAAYDKGGKPEVFDALADNYDSYKGMNSVFLFSALGVSLASSLDSFLGARKNGESAAKGAALGLIPGAGQLANGQPGKASLFAAAGAATLMGAIVYMQAGSKAQDAYKVAGEPTTEFDALADNYDSFKGMNNLFFYATIGLVSISAIDSFWYGRKGGSYGMNIEDDEIQLSYKLKF